MLCGCDEGFYLVWKFGSFVVSLGMMCGVRDGWILYL